MVSRSAPTGSVIYFAMSLINRQFIKSFENKLVIQLAFSMSGLKWLQVNQLPTIR